MACRAVAWKSPSAQPDAIAQRGRCDPLSPRRAEPRSGEHPAGVHVQKRLYWAPTWTVIFVLSPILYLLVYFIARKKGDLIYCLGPSARKRRRQALQFGGGGALLSLVTVFVAIDRWPGVSLIAMMVFLLLLIFALVRGRVVNVMRITKDTIHLKLRPEAAAAFARAQAGG